MLWLRGRCGGCCDRAPALRAQARDTLRRRGISRRREWRASVAGRFTEPDVPRDNRVEHACPGKTRGCRAATCCPRLVRSSYIVINTPAISSPGLNAARTRRSVATRSARPSSAKYSQFSGIKTASAATSAFNVSSPSEGGYRPGCNRTGRASDRDSRAGGRSRWGSADEVDFRTGQVSIGGNQREAVDRRSSTRTACVVDFRGQRLIDGPASRASVL